MSTANVARLAREALEAGEGMLRLAPNWVPRSFLHPGRRLKLAAGDLYALGTHRGGIDERWLSSCIPADNPGAPLTEGLSVVVLPQQNRTLERSRAVLSPADRTGDGPALTLRDAVAELGADLLGREIWDRYGRWPVFGKFFDNMGMIPHHLHQDDALAALVGREGKPEAYYFPPQLNRTVNNFPYTFFGLEPGTTRDDVRRCLECWDRGDNGILELSRAYKLTPGTGWLIGPRILHAPGSLVTFEPQWASDVLAIFQNVIEDRVVPRALLVKDVPREKQNDLDFLVGLLDWEANVDPQFKQSHFLPPVPDARFSGDGVVDRWVVYGKIHGRQLFTAKELTLAPGARLTIRDGGPGGAAYGLVVTQGRGRIGAPGREGTKLELECPTLIRFGELSADEVFVSAKRAAEGVEFENTSTHQPLVTLRYFGPDAQPAAP
jgi:hypothetical protein